MVKGKGGRIIFYARVRGFRGVRGVRGGEVFRYCRVLKNILSPFGMHDLLHAQGASSSECIL